MFNRAVIIKLSIMILIIPIFILFFDYLGAQILAKFYIRAAWALKYKVIFWGNKELNDYWNWRKLFLLAGLIGGYIFSIGINIYFEFLLKKEEDNNSKEEIQNETF